jgi:putative oxidoreductase
MAGKRTYCELYKSPQNLSRLLNLVLMFFFGDIDARRLFMKIIMILGRLLYSAIFIFSGFSHFKAETVGYAQSQGVPLANLAVPLSGAMAILGGLSILLGLKAKYGALLLVVFLVPVTLMMHNFWNISDPMQRQIQMVMFMKNLSMLGGALIIFMLGSGPASLDSKLKKA